MVAITANIRQAHKIPLVNSGDCLPSFEMLTSDEDRERKAEGSVPGTYHVVVIPESFALLPEYTESVPEKSIRDQALHPLFTNSETNQSDIAPKEDNPNVVILKDFRDMRRPSPINRKCSAPPLDSDSPIRTPSTTSSFQGIMPEPQQGWPEPDINDILLRHFRGAVWAQLFSETALIDCPSGSYRLSSELFEQEAARSPRVRAVLFPLLYCMYLW